MIEKELGPLSDPYLIHLDPGGFSDFFSEAGVLRTNCLLSVYEKWGVDAINVSARELINGVELFESEIAGSSVPFVSANIINKSTGTPRYKPYVTLNIGKEKIAVIGFSRQFSKTWSLENGETVYFESPELALPKYIKQLRKEANIIILLAHYPLRKLDGLLAEIPPADIVIGSDSYSVTREKTVIHGAIISYAGKEGKWVSMLSETGETFDYSVEYLNVEKPEHGETKATVDECEKRVREEFVNKGTTKRDAS